MPTSRFRPTTQASRKLVGTVVFAAAILGHADSSAQQGPFVVPQENPNRPPWAQKNKSADAAAKPAAKAEASDPAQDRGKIEVNVNLVNVLVSVLDDRNRPAPDLPLDAFRIFDEDNPQAIAVFEKETEQPLDLALMIDASLSAQLSMPAQREAATHFIQQVLRKGDHLAVYSVDENVTQLAAFSDNVGHLQEVVRHIPAGAGTSIYDAVLLGARALSRQGADRRRVIILVTDGGETSVFIAVSAAHRAAAFDACRYAIDTLKKIVPIWKKEFFADGAVWADGEIPPAPATAETPAAKPASN